jgi:hypothetical protein
MYYIYISYLFIFILQEGYLKYLLDVSLPSLISAAKKGDRPSQDTAFTQGTYVYAMAQLSVLFVPNP